ncbi:MAG: hypothetical protein V7603_286 [Micromonosporaceae bacterium]
MVRRTANSSRVLLLLLLAGVAIVGVLGAGSARDAVIPVHLVAPPGHKTIGLFASHGGRPVTWLLWTALPSATVIVALLALMLWTLATARRHGLYHRSTLRLLRVTALVGLLGGPVAALVEALSGRWTSRDYSYTPAVGRWQLAALLVLLGCAFLAVREVLARASALHAELDGVI